MKKNGIIHLRAIERELLPEAKLNKTFSKEISNDDFTIDDRNVQHGEDYFTLTYENRSMNLDTIVGIREELLTGVRLRLVGGRLRLEARFTFFDDTTGQLNTEIESRWTSNEKSDRSLIKSDHLHVPIDARRQADVENSADGNYIQFGPTGWTQDMAQSTVPFIDTTPVEANDGIPVSGVGVLYKSTPGYAGFVAPKLFMYDSAAAAMRIRAAVGVYGV